MGLESGQLSTLAARVGGPWRECDVSQNDQVETAVEELVGELGGLDVFVANAGIAKQLPLLGGDVEVMERTLAVNTLGAYYTLRAAGPHISHPGGYGLLISSLGAAVNLPLLGAYSASKAAVETMANTLRQELRHTGATAGCAYFAELDTDMTSRGFATEAGHHLTGGGTVSGVAPLEAGISALERGIARRARRIGAPFWVPAVVPTRDVAQRVIELVAPRRFPKLAEALEIARTERVAWTTEQPTEGAGAHTRSGGLGHPDLPGNSA